MSVTNKQKVAVGGGRRTNQKLGARGKKGGVETREERIGGLLCLGEILFHLRLRIRTLARIFLPRYSTSPRR